MNSSIIRDCIIIVGCAILGFVPFDKERIRAGWAKLTFGIIAIIGIADGIVRLAWDSGWFTLGSEANSLLNCYIYMVGGVNLGFLFSLIFSGQLLGAKRD